MPMHFCKLYDFIYLIFARQTSLINTVRPGRSVLGMLALAAAAGLAGSCHGAEVPHVETPRTSKDLTNLSLEELLNINVTSVSKRPEHLVSAPAAVYVLTNEDIRRSGATSIPEALRAVPGLNVARSDSHTWAISARGFNDAFANKLLVLMDGREVYTPLFSGVFWDVQGTMLEDVERVEVIRGPGATLWGANAVNGVINIITKSPKDTVGGITSVTGGTVDQGFADIRYGAQVTKDSWIRGYATFTNTGASELPNGDRANDRWYQGRAGFRYLLEPSMLDTVNVQGDIYSGRNNETYNVPNLFTSTVDSDRHVDSVAGGNVLARWTHGKKEEANFSLQAFADYTDRSLLVVHELRQTYDVDFQYNLPVNDRNRIVFGTDYRLTADEQPPREFVQFRTRHDTLGLVSGFAQDEYKLLNNLTLTAGSKFEYNTYTHFEFEPSARLAWSPASKQTVWTAISRSVRTPSRGERDGTIESTVQPPGALGAGTPQTLVSVVGSRRVVSEVQISGEVGYRVEPLSRLSFDLAAFYSDYRKVRSIDLQPPVVQTTPVPHLALDGLIGNNLQGVTYGGELVVNGRPTDWWRIQATYSNLEMAFDTTAGGKRSNLGLEKDSPRHSLTFRNSFDLPHHVQIDASLRYVDQLKDLKVPAYTTSDVRIGWAPTSNLDVSVCGQNLFQPRHQEFTPTTVMTPTTEVERSVYLKMTLKF